MRVFQRTLRAPTALCKRRVNADGWFSHDEHFQQPDRRAVVVTRFVGHPFNHAKLEAPF